MAEQANTLIHKTKPKSEKPSEKQTLGDLRFRALLNHSDWFALPAATRKRFSKCTAGGITVVYVGTVADIKMSRAGKWLAHVLRIIGAPLPISEDVHVPTVVTVTEDVATGGQIWTRLYANNKTFPQVIHSAKRFSGPTGLEEYIGFGIAMALRIRVVDAVLTFESAGYFLKFGKLRIRIPKWLEPGDLAVTHRDLGNRNFEFALTLNHKKFGTLLRQVGLYREDPDG